MNPSTFNDAVRQLSPLIGQSLVNELCHSPLFVGDSNVGNMPQDHVKDTIEDLLTNGVLRFPFSKMRVNVDGQWGAVRSNPDDRTFDVVMSEKDQNMIYCRFCFEISSKPPTAEVSRMFPNVGSDFFAPSVIKGMLVKNGKILDTSPEYSWYILQWTIARMSVLSCLLNLPGTFAAKKTPPANGRSVEWVKKNERIVIIHKHNKVNNAQFQKGHIVSHTKDENDQEKQRIAHARAEHWRVLKDKRYKRDANGSPKRIRIKESWVGPEEWKDPSGATYKIVTHP